MGLLKLGSIYKKKSKKESSAPPVPIKTEKPTVPLGLNLNLNNSSSIGTSHLHPTTSTTTTTTPAGSGSLFDDIFAELGTKPVATAPPVELKSGPKPAAKGNKREKKITFCKNKHQMN